MRTKTDQEIIITMLNTSGIGHDKEIDNEKEQMRILVSVNDKGFMPVYTFDVKGDLYSIGVEEALYEKDA